MDLHEFLASDKQIVKLRKAVARLEGAKQRLLEAERLATALFVYSTSHGITLDKGWFSLLPHELINIIVSFIDQASYRNLYSTCKWMSQMPVIRIYPRIRPITERPQELEYAMIKLKFLDKSIGRCGVYTYDRFYRMDEKWYSVALGDTIAYLHVTHLFVLYYDVYLQKRSDAFALGGTTKYDVSFQDTRSWIATTNEMRITLRDSEYVGWDAHVKRVFIKYVPKEYRKLHLPDIDFTDDFYGIRVVGSFRY
jgi:hypothetical protein